MHEITEENDSIVAVVGERAWKVFDRETKKTISAGKHEGPIEDVVMLAFAAHAIAKARRGTKS